MDRLYQTHQVCDGLGYVLGELQRLLRERDDPHGRISYLFYALWHLSEAARSCVEGGTMMLLTLSRSDAMCASRGWSPLGAHYEVADIGTQLVDELGAVNGLYPVGMARYDLPPPTEASFTTFIDAMLEVVHAYPYPTLDGENPPPDARIVEIHAQVAEQWEQLKELSDVALSPRRKFAGADFNDLRSEAIAEYLRARLIPASVRRRIGSRAPIGRRLSTDPARDANLAERWEAARRAGRTMSDFAQDVGMKQPELQRALDRDRKRRGRKN